MVREFRAALVVTKSKNKNLKDSVKLSDILYVPITELPNCGSLFLCFLADVH